MSNSEVSDGEDNSYNDEDKGKKELENFLENLKLYQLETENRAKEGLFDTDESSGWSSD